MKRLISISLVVLLVFSFMPTAVFAQEGCDAWASLSLSVFDRYNGIRLGRDIQTAIQMQALRRELATFDISVYSAGDRLYNALTGLINLSADSIVAELAGDAALASDLTIQVTNVYEKVAQQLPVTCGKASITSPENGVEVTSFRVTVQGIYDPELLGEDDLWVFMKTQDQLYFPQVVDGCGENPTSVARNPQRNPPEWSTLGFFGTATEGIGDTFEVVLFSGGEAASELVWGYYDAACPLNNFPGLMASEIFDSGAFTELHHITVTRIS